MKAQMVGHVDGRVVARSPDPPTIYLSNPDWAVTTDGPILLWDRFGGEHRIELARLDGDRWRRIASFDDAMHSHLIDLPEQGLRLVLGVVQNTHPRSICLWHTEDGDDWRGPTELFGGADFHAGSTPWTIHDGVLHVPFEIQQTKQWGSYCFGSVHADLTNDLRRPGAWRLSQSRVPWTVFPGCEACGALEGNLYVADGRLYNLLRIPAYSRLGRAVWEDGAWRWLGLVQGVHNQSKPEIFQDQAGDWFLLANGWPERLTATAEHGFRNTLCLWRADEPDLSRFSLLRVIAGDLDPRHAYSYAAGAVAPDGTAWFADRHGDDETWNYHDTDCIAVRSVPEFAAWCAEPALVAYGHDEVEPDGTWIKGNCQDGLLLSHLDGALYPLTLSATVRIDALPEEIGALDLLGFATCDLVLIAGLQLVDERSGPRIALSSGGRRHRLELPVERGTVLDLSLVLHSPAEVEVRSAGQSLLRCRTHCVSDPSLAGVIPRADRPAAALGRVALIEPPRLTCGETACDAPALREPWILADARGVSRNLPGDQPPPVENLAPGGPLVCGGHTRFFDPWAGGLLPGAKSAALWSPLEAVPASFSLAGFARPTGGDEAWTVVLAALGERSAACDLRRDMPYAALLLIREPAAGPRLAVAWSNGDQRELVVASTAVGEWFGYALCATAGDEGLAVRVYGGEPGGAASELFATTLPAACVAEARHWLALIGQRGGEVWSVGGQVACRAALSEEEIGALFAAGYALKLDSQPARRPSCASEPAPEPLPEPEAVPEPTPPEQVAPAADDPALEAELAALKALADAKPAEPVSEQTLADWEQELAAPPPPPDGAEPEPEPPTEL